MRQPDRGTSHGSMRQEGQPTHPAPLIYTLLTSEAVTFFFCLGLPILPERESTLLLSSTVLLAGAYLGIIINGNASYARGLRKVAGWIAIFMSASLGFVAASVVKHDEANFVGIGLFFLLSLAIVRGCGGVLLVKLQYMELPPPGASLAMVARENNRLGTFMQPTTRTSASSDLSPHIVVPAHSASRGGGGIRHEEIGVDVGYEGGVYERERIEGARAQGGEERLRQEATRERQKRLNRMRNKHRVRTSLRGRDEEDDSERKTDGDNGVEGNSCSICLEEVWKDGDNRMLECGHVFHTKCINQWLCDKRGHDKMCPVCRFLIR